MLRTVAAFIGTRVLVAFAACASMTLHAAQGTAEDQTQFPYVAYVVEGTTLVRSGPAEKFYATGELPRGAAVEVYRHDADGWCAVRPPEGSFSLVPTGSVRVLDPRLGEATVDDLPVRAGSALGDQRSAVQVRLKRGERIELLAPPRPQERLIRIAPPAGEFRWIAARGLSRVPPTEHTPLPLPAASQWQAYGARRAAADRRREAPDSPDPKAGDFDHLQQPGGAVTAGFDEPIEVIPGSPAAVQLAQHDRYSDQRAAAPSAAPPLVEQAGTSPDNPQPPLAGATSGMPRVRFPGRTAAPVVPATPRLAELQLELSRAIAAPTTEWRLGGVREETAALLASSKSAVEREQLRTLLERIVKFEEIAAQRAQLASTSKPTRDSSQVAGTSDPLDVFDASEQAASEQRTAFTGQTESIREMVRRDLGIDPAADAAAGNDTAKFAGTEARYDAVGTLKPVVSRRGGAPQFALVDDEGEIVSLITPGPDVNMQSLIGQRVGVAGARGFMPEYRRPHVTAERVIPLSDGGTTLR